jgi:hypothetical protein
MMLPYRGTMFPAKRVKLKTVSLKRVMARTQTIHARIAKTANRTRNSLLSANNIRR